MNDGTNDSKTWRCYGFALFAFVLLLGVSLLNPVHHNQVLAQGPTPTCTQPNDVDIAFAFCDAAHDDLADDYSSPLKDVSTDGYIPPVILKAMAWRESDWTQCANGEALSPVPAVATGAPCRFTAA